MAPSSRGELREVGPVVNRLTEPIIYLTDEQLPQSEYAMLLTRRLEYCKFYQLGN